MMKKADICQCLFIAAGLFFACGGFFCFAAEESIIVTTYYPSPYGVYGEMRLYPKPYSQATPCDATQEGLMFYDNDSSAHTLKVCRCTNAPTCVTSSDFGWVAATNYWTLTGTNLYPNSNTWNVGIGTASPNYKLDVTDSSYVAIRAFSTVAGQASQFILGNDAYANAALFLMGGTSYGSYGGSNALSIATTGNSDISLLTNAVERIRLKSTGNVRIGNAGIGGSPAAQLEVDSNSYPAMYARGNTGDLAIQLSNVGVNGRNFRLDSTANGSAYGVGKFVIADDSAGGSPARLAIDQFGNVGIGTASPAEKLEVSGNIRLSGASPTYKVTNVATPTAASDVATKGYVDGLGGDLVAYRYIYGGQQCPAVSNVQMRFAIAFCNQPSGCPYGPSWLQGDGNCPAFLANACACFYSSR